MHHKNPQHLNQILISKARQQLKDYIHILKQIKASQIKEKKYWLQFYKENINIEKKVLTNLQGLKDKLPDKEIEVKDLNSKIISKYKQLTKTK